MQLIGNPEPSFAYIPKTALNNEEFEHLKKSLQLLRISQIRYLVQKFSLPANGNKTRLLSIILGLIDNLRPTPLLVQISAEVNKLIAQQHEPFTNPLESMQKVSIFNSNEDLIYPEHPFIRLLDAPPLMPPHLALAGTSSGSYTFMSPQKDSKILIVFAWFSKDFLPFELQCELNNVQISISIDDPYPLPIDITDLVFSPNKSPNVFTISFIKTPVPIILSINEYSIITMDDVINDFCRMKNIIGDNQNLFIKGRECLHEKFVPLEHHFSVNLARRSSFCLVCGKLIDPKNCLIIRK